MGVCAFREKNVYFEETSEREAKVEMLRRYLDREKTPHLHPVPVSSDSEHSSSMSEDIVVEEVVETPGATPEVGKPVMRESGVQGERWDITELRVDSLGGEVVRGVVKQKIVMREVSTDTLDFPFPPIPVPPLNSYNPIENPFDSDNQPSDPPEPPRFISLDDSLHLPSQSSDRDRLLLHDSPVSKREDVPESEEYEELVVGGVPRVLKSAEIEKESADLECGRIEDAKGREKEGNPSEYEGNPPEYEGNPPEYEGNPPQYEGNPPQYEEIPSKSEGKSITDEENPPKSDEIPGEQPRIEEEKEGVVEVEMSQREDVREGGSSVEGDENVSESSVSTPRYTDMPTRHRGSQLLTFQSSRTRLSQDAAFVFLRTRIHYLRNPAPLLTPELLDLNLQGRLTIEGEEGMKASLRLSTEGM